MNLYEYQMLLDVQCYTIAIYLSSLICSYLWVCYQPYPWSFSVLSSSSLLSSSLKQPIQDWPQV